MNIFSVTKIRANELKTIIHYTGYIAIVMGIMTIIPIICALIYNDAKIYLNAFIISGIICIVSGLLMYYIFKEKNITNLSLKGSLIFVMSIWGFTALFAALPYFFCGDLSLVDAFFEGMSGITTTGFSMYDCYTFPYSISMWRVLTQWMGGLGIIFLLLVVAPSSVSLKRLYFAEGKTEQMTPNIMHSATIFIKVYLIITAIGILLYLLIGLDLFDAICYSFASIGTGGYTIHPDSVNNFINPSVQLVTIILMIMGATNFVLHYRIMKREWKNLHKDIELNAMLCLIIIATILIAISLYVNGLYNYDILTIGRHSLFQAVSILTSTGFASTDINLWPPFAYHIIILLMFIGGSVCSTAGGIKIYNIMILLKAIWWETQRMFLPKNTIIKRKIYHDKKKRDINDDTIRSITIFIIVYILIFVFSSMIVLIYTKNFEMAYTLVASSMGNTGVGPAFINPGISIVVKIVLIIDFWVGRIGVWPLLLSIVYLTHMTVSKVYEIKDKI